VTGQAKLRRHIAELEKIQAERMDHVARLAKQLGELIERKQREIENLKAQLTIQTVP
jgi:hypothetical protein